MENNKFGDNKEELAQEGLKALKKEFLVIGKAHIKAWHAWLILGLVAGITAGVLFVANRSGRFELGRASDEVEIVGEEFLSGFAGETSLPEDSSVFLEDSLELIEEESGG